MSSIIRTILILVVIYTTFRPIYPRRLNEGFGSLLPHTYQMLPDEGRRLQRPKRCINNNKDEDSPNNTTHTNNTSSQKHRDIVCSIMTKAETKVEEK